MEHHALEKDERNQGWSIIVIGPIVVNRVVSSLLLFDLVGSQASAVAPVSGAPHPRKEPRVPAEHTWVGIGLAGQACFFSRFLVQWIASERQGRSVVPRAFWYLSISGGLILLSYSLWRRDPVFILGQSVGLFVYLRNLVLLRREDTAR
jgi:lipid-A-disaccharide synthase-like uncharacterized protein